MTRFMRASRGTLVAVAILGLTAGIALAGRADPASHSMPDAAGPGLQRAADAAGKTVPVAAPDAAADHPANHGADVSAAAQAVTPAGFDNHGQYVRSVATANHGQEVAAS